MYGRNELHNPKSITEVIISQGEWESLHLREIEMI